MSNGKPKGVQCPSDVQDAVKSLLAEHTENDVLMRLGLSRNAVVRLAAGLTVRQGTIAQVRAKLAECA
jgi:hypothetical protein